MDNFCINCGLGGSFVFIVNIFIEKVFSVIFGVIINAGVTNDAYIIIIIIIMLTLLLLLIIGPGSSSSYSSDPL